MLSDFYINMKLKRGYVQLFGRCLENSPQYGGATLAQWINHLLNDQATQF